MVLILDKDRVRVKVFSVTVNTASGTHIFDTSPFSSDNNVELSNGECAVRLAIEKRGEIAVLGAEVSCNTGLQEVPLVLSLEISPSPTRFLALTNLHMFKHVYEHAMGYYNQITIGTTPVEPSPPEDFPYPEPDLSHVPDPLSHYLSIPAWLYPYHGDSMDKVPPYTPFVLSEVAGGHLGILSLSDIAIAYIGPGLRVAVFAGNRLNKLPYTKILAVGAAADPYYLTSQLVKGSSSLLGFKTRGEKEKPFFLRYLGWCTWNALGLRDLSESNMVRIVSELVAKQVPIRYVIIDDGWQVEVSEIVEAGGYKMVSRILRQIEPEPRRFKDFKALVSSLRSIGINEVGIWHTINVHWGGITRELAEEIGIDAKPFIGKKGMVPSEEVDWRKMYEELYSYFEKAGFTLVKVDNQWVSEIIGVNSLPAGESARILQKVLQESALTHRLSILNCMSLTPGNLFNYWLSNVTRASIDYVPYWKTGAKLHNFFALYNSVLLAEISYPDYDMFMSYDPHALVHLVFRVLSGGPIYITDRDPEKTNVSLIRRAVLPNGEVVRPDEPARPTLDVLYKNPYSEKVLLKAFTKLRDQVVVAAANVNRSGKPIRDVVSLKHVTYEPLAKKYVVYEVFSGDFHVLNDPHEEIEVELGELETEVYVYAPIVDGVAVVGIVDYLLPGYPVTRSNNTVCSVAKGILKYYERDHDHNVHVDENSCIEIGE